MQLRALPLFSDHSVADAPVCHYLDGVGWRAVQLLLCSMAERGACEGERGERGGRDEKGRKNKTEY